MRCPSLDYVYDMTWAEFMIRLFAWKRREKMEIFMLRELAWVTYIAPNQDPKRMKKTKESFWPIKGKSKKSDASETMRKRIMEAQEQYHKELKNKENGR